MLVDANLLIYATDTASPRHEQAKHWLVEQLNGSRRVGIPWSSFSAFLRLSTNPRLMARPYGASEAWNTVADWLSLDVVWVPQPTPRHGEVLGRLIVTHGITGNLVPDAQLAALAIEHGLTIYSNDSDFARFPEITWVDPLRE